MYYTDNRSLYRQGISPESNRKINIFNSFSELLQSKDVEGIKNFISRLVVRGEASSLIGRLLQHLKSNDPTLYYSYLNSIGIKVLEA